MGRKPCCEKEGMNKGAWTAMEDKLLADCISINGEGKWRNLPINAGLKRCGKSCRMRWLNYLRPDIKRGNITSEEEDLIIRLHNLLGNRWSLIAPRLPGRTDNEIKNYWNTHIGKKLAQQSHVGNPKEPMVCKPPLPRHNHHQYPLPSTLTCAIRTKATRCTKVIIPKELHDIQQKKDIEVEKKPVETTFNNNESMSMLLMDPQDVVNQDSLWAFDDSKSTAPKIDAELEMDDIIYSKILEEHEFFPYSDFQNQQQEQQNDHTTMSSVVMNDNQFFGQDMHGEFDVDWIKNVDWIKSFTELMEETS